MWKFCAVFLIFIRKFSREMSIFDSQRLNPHKMLQMGTIAAKIDDTRLSVKQLNTVQGEMRGLERALVLKDHFDHLSFVNTRLENQIEELTLKMDDNSNLLKSYQYAIKDLDKDELDQEMDRRVSVKYDEIRKREKERVVNKERELKTMEHENQLRGIIDGNIRDRNSFKQFASSILSQDFNQKKQFTSEYETYRMQEELRQMDEDLAFEQKKKQIEDIGPGKEDNWKYNIYDRIKDGKKLGGEQLYDIQEQKHKYMGGLDERDPDDLVSKKSLRQSANTQRQDSSTRGDSKKGKKPVKKKGKKKK